MGAGVGMLRRALAHYLAADPTHTRDRFAREVLGRTRVSVYRWLKGSAIPPAVVTRLKSYLLEARALRQS